MRSIYRHTEIGFEKLISLAIAIIDNSITFIIAFCLVKFWLSDKRFYSQDIHNSIGDIILGVAFLSLFIIQKSFNRFSASLHLKVNELVKSHDLANNAVINTEEKSVHALIELSKEYAELADQAKEDKDEKP